MRTEPLRILQIGLTPNLGGIESFIINLYKAIDRTKIQFDFIDMYDGIAYADEIKAMGGRIFAIPFFKRHPLDNLISLCQLMKQYHFDYIHVNMLSAAYFLPFLAAKITKTPIIAHSHNSGTDSGIFRKILHYIGRPLVAKLASYKFACSSLAEKWLFGSHGKAVFIPNAIDVSLFSFNPDIRHKIRQELSLENKWILGHVGRFAEQKNHTFLIQVFAAISACREDAVLVLVGTGPLQTQIRQLVQEKGLSQKVLFLGARRDVAHLYQGFDVFLLPSLYEGLPVCAVEAQFAALPCFLADTITKEVNFTDSIFLSINRGEKPWVTALTTCQTERKDIRGKGHQFNLAVLSKKMQEFYITGKTIF